MLLPYSALILAVAIWGGAIPVIKATTEHISPFTFLFLRFLLVCIIMLPVMVVLVKRSPFDKRDYKNLVLLGLAGQSSIIIIFWGINFTSALDAAIIGTLAPLLTIAAGQYFYGDRLNKLTKIGIFIAVVGMLVVVLEPILSDSHAGYDVGRRIFGNILVVIYTLLFTLYIIWSKMVMGGKSPNLDSVFKHIHLKPMKKVYSPVQHVSFAFYVGLVSMLPFALLESRGAFGSQLFSISDLSTTSVLGIIYMAIFSSIVAYISFEWGLKNAQVSDEAIFGYLGPLFTIPFAYIILGETPTTMNIVGGLIIAVGVVIAEKYKPK